MQVFNGLALNPLDRINMPNKQSSTKRFRTDTAIKLNHSTSYLRKRGKQLPVILLLTHWSLFGFSLGGSLNLSFSKEVCEAGYTIKYSSLRASLLTVLRIAYAIVRLSSIGFDWFFFFSVSSISFD